MIVEANLLAQRKALTGLAGQLSVLSVRAEEKDVDLILDIGADIELVAHGIKFKVPVTIGDDSET